MGQSAGRVHRRDLLPTDHHLGHCCHQQGNWNTERGERQRFVTMRTGCATAWPDSHCWFVNVFFLFLQRFLKTIRPLNSWRVNNASMSARAQEDLEPESVDTPYTVTLTDMDFNAMAWEIGSQAWRHRQNGQWRTDRYRIVVRRRIFFYVIWRSLALAARLRVLQGRVDLLHYLCYRVYFNCIFRNFFLYNCRK